MSECLLRLEPLLGVYLQAASDKVHHQLLIPRQLRVDLAVLELRGLQVVELRREHYLEQ
jgi:hypothetical protein